MCIRDSSNALYYINQIRKRAMNNAPEGGLQEYVGTATYYLPDGMDPWAPAIICLLYTSLSYTTFTYSDLHISPSHQGVQGDIHVSCKIKNTGKKMCIRDRNKDHSP